jgi:protein TonB
MKLASFVILSLTLHAIALAYPISFHDFRVTELIPVTIVQVEPAPRAARADDGRGGGASQPAAKMKAAAQKVNHKIESESLRQAEPPVLTEESPSQPNPSDAAFVSALADPAPTDGAAIYGSTSRDANPGKGGAGISGDGSGSAGTGAGAGNGQASFGNGTGWIQARYRETPKPEYPESARAEGREGRVLLRVLVDDQGRTKSVEINAGSGNDALDRAAIEAIKRWRFHPARHGDKPVESWLRIPIEFRLADAKSR